MSTSIDKQRLYERHENELLSLAKEMKEHDILNCAFETKYGNIHLVLFDKQQ